MSRTCLVHTVTTAQAAFAALIIVVDKDGYRVPTPYVFPRHPWPIPKRLVGAYCAYYDSSRGLYWAAFTPELQMLGSDESGTTDLPAGRMIPTGGYALFRSPGGSIENTHGIAFIINGFSALDPAAGDLVYFGVDYE